MYSVLCLGQTGRSVVHSGRPDTGETKKKDKKKDKDEDKKEDKSENKKEE